MLNIEVIKFEAQDVITASGCNHTGYTHTVVIEGGNPVIKVTCNNCGAKGTSTAADINAGKVNWN